MTYLLFSHILLLQLTFILRPFARSGLSPLIVMAAHGSHHVDLEYQILALGSTTLACGKGFVSTFIVC